MDCLAAKGNTLTEIKELLLNVQPGRETATRMDSLQARILALPGWDVDALSMRASCSQFCEDMPGQVEASTLASDTCS